MSLVVIGIYDNFFQILKAEYCSLIDSVPKAVQVGRHHGDVQTNKPTKRDGRVAPLISTLHNADKAQQAIPLAGIL